MVSLKTIREDINRLVEEGKKQGRYEGLLVAESILRLWSENERLIEPASNEELIKISKEKINSLLNKD